MCSSHQGAHLLTFRAVDLSEYSVDSSCVVESHRHLLTCRLYRPGKAGIVQRCSDAGMQGCSVSLLAVLPPWQPHFDDMFDDPAAEVPVSPPHGLVRKRQKETFDLRFVINPSWLNSSSSFSYFPAPGAWTTNASSIAPALLAAKASTSG